MIGLREKYSEKDKISAKKIKEAFEFRNEKSPYYIFTPAYWLFGDDADYIPEDYCGEDPQSMIDIQLEKIENHYQNFKEDCYMGYFMPWYGTAVLASGFGTKIGFGYKMDPAADMSEIKFPEEIDKLKMPDPYNDGLMPRALNAIKRFKDYCDLPITLTDCQGPLTTALSIIGYSNFIYWMYDYPEKIHKLMDIVSDAYIDWVKLQKDLIGMRYEDEITFMGIKMPEGSGGICLSDDDCLIFGAEQYKEFVMPYNSKIFNAFGGGGLHFCGAATHHLDNFTNTDGLTCLNNINMDDLEGAALLKKALDKKNIPLILCDFPPSDDRLEAYYDDLFRLIPQKGTLVVSYITPIIGLDKGKYVSIKRDKMLLSKRIESIIINKREEYL